MSAWHLVSDDGLEVLEEMPCPGGKLVRCSWRHPRGIGVDPLSGSAMAFVPDVHPPVVPVRVASPLAPHPAAPVVPAVPHV